MSENNNNNMTQAMHRRDFLKHSAVAGAVAAAFSMGLPLHAFAGEATPKRRWRAAPGLGRGQNHRLAGPRILERHLYLCRLFGGVQHPD